MIERANHRKRVCLAVLEALEARAGTAFDDLVWADEAERNEKAVDLTFRSSTARYALEHTKIESFDGQIEHFHQIRGWVEALRSQLEGKLPRPGHFVVSFVPGAAAGFKPRPETVRALAEWIERQAPSLRLGSPEAAPHHWIQGRPDAAPFEITLTRWPRRDGELSFADWVPDSLEGRRRLRIRLALEAKLPKLLTASGDGASSILVLESDDISLANAWNVAVAFQEEVERLQDQVPDRVWLVETDAEPWHAWELKSGHEALGANHRMGHLEIDSATKGDLLLKWSLRFRQGRWNRYSEWERGQALGPRPGLSQALAWMWDAWQLARAHNPEWGRPHVDEAHIRRLREAVDALGRLKAPK